MLADNALSGLHNNNSYNIYLIRGYSERSRALPTKNNVGSGRDRSDMAQKGNEFTEAEQLRKLLSSTIRFFHLRQIVLR